MGTSVSKELLVNQVQEVKDYMKTLPVMSWVTDNPWKSLGILIGSKIFLWDWLLFRIRNRDLPPGPLGLPIFGNIGVIPGGMGKNFSAMREQYGEVLYLRMLDRDMVVLNSHHAIKQAFVRQGSEFASKSLAQLMPALDFKDEIFMAPYNEEFKVHKKFAANALRSLGFGTRSLEGKIQAEIDKVCDILQQNAGKSINPEKLLQKANANVICSILFDKQYAFDDPELEEIVKRASDFLSIFIDGFILLFSPKIISLLISRKLIKSASEKSRNLRDFTLGMAKEHRETLDSSNARDFIDVYLIDRKDENLSDEMIGDTAAVFFPDAIHTATIMMRWVLLYIVLHPEVQEKIHKELDKNVGQSRNPKEGDKLNYTQATIREAVRISNLIDVLAPHLPTKETTLLGYRIPKDVFVIANIHGVHFDETIYPDPHQFNPERFLDEDGNFVKDDTWLPFGTGPRMCMGEKLAKQEMLLIIANLFQKFHFKFPEDKPTPTTKPTSPEFGSPQDFEIIPIPR